MCYLVRDKFTRHHSAGGRSAPSGSTLVTHHFLYFRACVCDGNAQERRDSLLYAALHRIIYPLLLALALLKVLGRARAFLNNPK